MGKVLVVVGLCIAGLSVLILLGVPLGRFPGDLVYRRGGVTVYVPLATSVVLSVVLTLVVMFVRR